MEEVVLKYLITKESDARKHGQQNTPCSYFLPKCFTKLGLGKEKNVA
jgi:hypothetical protein